MTLSKSDIETDILSELKDKKESINQIFTTKDTQQDIAKENNEIIEWVDGLLGSCANQSIGQDGLRA